MLQSRAAALGVTVILSAQVSPASLGYQAIHGSAVACACRISRGSTIVVVVFT